MTSNKHDNYNLKNIHDLLLEGFSDNELRNLCLDEPKFKELKFDLAKHYNRTEIVNEIIAYTDRKICWDDLLRWAKKKNPTRYQHHRHYQVSIFPIIATNLRKYISGILILTGAISYLLLTYPILTYSGYIFDANTLKAIGLANAQLEFTSGDFFENQTDSDGFYRFTKPLPFIKLIDQKLDATLSIQKEGYEQFSRHITLNFAESSQDEQAIYLSPIFTCHPEQFYEDNDKFEDACLIKAGHLYLAHSQDTNDVYYFEIEELSNVTITINGYASDGQLLLYKDPNLNQPIGRKKDIRFDATLTLTNSSPGKYYLLIFTSSNYQNNRPYRFDLTISPQSS